MPLSSRIELTQFNDLLNHLNGKRFFVIVDYQVADLYRDHLARLTESLLFIGQYVVDEGEAAKSLAGTQKIIDAMLSCQLSRRDIILAIGGGVTLDVAGFVASIYKRGLDWLAVPTTLLAMVDAAIGGKTAINYNQIKNSVGTFWFPQLTLYWLPFLETLSAQQWRSGMGECIKYAYLSDQINFDDVSSLARLQRNATEVVDSCASYKEEIVSIDKYERDLRQILNFGHSFGHIIEASPRNQLTHGEAIIYGIAVSLYISTKIADLAYDVFGVYLAWLQSRPWYDRSVFAVDSSDLQLLLNDKKSQACRVGLVVLESVNMPIISALDYEEVIAHYRAFRELFNEDHPS